ncbi:MAG TPA: hypothetical protein VGR15_09580 [Bacteroidota bacterium]|jgi:hypothetical protein|nr:hypothetical protein [Bacteroidota bacterium]
MRLLVRSLIYLVIFSSVCAIPAVSEIIKSGSFQASSDGVNVTLRWYTEDEAKVVRFEIERRSGTTSSFTMIGDLDAKGPSLYEFVDNSAFQKIVTVYQYRVKVVYSNGVTPTYSSIVTVSHTVSGVRRTWGSIKAMFR